MPLMVSTSRAMCALLFVSAVAAANSQHRIAAWGGNSFDKTIPPLLAKDVVTVAAGSDFHILLLSDGTVSVWGSLYLGTPPPGLNGVKAIGAGSSHGMAVESDGTVVCWGANGFGESTVPDGLDNVVAVAGGSSHSLALRADGTVVGWGRNNFGQVTIPPGLDNVKAIAAAGHHSLALKGSGTVVAWGSNVSGESTVPVGLQQVVAIAAGFSHSMALTASGNIFSWGSDAQGQRSAPREASGAKAIAAGLLFSLALMPDGQVLAWGSNSVGQTKIPPQLHKVSAIFAGGVNGIALVEDFAQPSSLASVLSGDTTRITINTTEAFAADFLRLKLAATGGLVVPETVEVQSESFDKFIPVVITVPLVDVETAAYITGQQCILETDPAKGWTVPISPVQVLIRPASLVRLEAPVGGVAGGSNANCRIVLNAAAGPSGIDVQVESLDPSLASPPPSVSFSPGQRSRNFNVPTLPVDTAASGTLRATHGGLTRTATLDVRPAYARELVLTAAIVSGGVSLNGNLARVFGVAGAAGVELTLASSNTAVATVPQKLTINATKSQVSFKIDTKPVASQQLVTIYMSGGGATVSATLTVNP